MNDNAKKLIVTDGETDARIHDGIEKYRIGDFCIRADVPVVKVTLKGSNNDSYAGGICCNNKTGGVIENCVVLGSIETTPSAYADVSNGAFAVENQGMIIQCFALDTVTEYAVGNANVLGNLTTQKDGLKTEAEMKSIDTYAGYNTDIWNIVAGDYPSLNRLTKIDK